ncbi:hypothetical protein BD414DRAFT_381634, partial [Trametes punicea]
METLPVELLAEIFTLAFTDGGHTACSVSLVNRRLYEACRPFRFQTVALDGSTPKVERFLATFEKERTELEPSTTLKVRQLYLDASRLYGRIDFASSWYHTLLRNDASEEEGEFAPQPCDKQPSAVASVLDMVSPHLEMLALHTPIFCSAIESISFPRLRELTIRCSALNFTPAEGSAPLYPALKRLHIIEFPVALHAWGFNAPNLTHLRVSLCRSISRIENLATLQCTSITRRSGRPKSTSPFSCLEKLIIQPDVCPPRRWDNGFDFAAHTALIDFLWQSQAQPVVPVYILPQGRSVALRKDWQCRLEGDESCWEISESYARSRYESVDPPAYLTPWE